MAFGYGLQDNVYSAKLAKLRKAPSPTLRTGLLNYPLNPGYLFSYKG